MELTFAKPLNFLQRGSYQQKALYLTEMIKIFNSSEDTSSL